MKGRLLVLIACVSCTQLGGCFFVFIPGSLIQKASDGITGAEGEHCVVRLAKVGDKVLMPGGTQGEIKSLSGESSRCRDPERPIRARIE